MTPAQRRTEATALLAHGLRILALPTGGGSAVDTINELQSRGYHVQVNTSTSGPLSSCSVTDVHGLSGSNIDSRGQRINSGQFDTVYVNVQCRPQG